MPRISWAVDKLTSWLPRRLKSRIRISLARMRSAGGGIEADYPRWVGYYDRTDGRIRRAVAAAIERMNDRPVISVLMPVLHPVPEHLEAAIESVRWQLYPAWELCIAVAAPISPPVEALLRAKQAEDSRITICWQPADGLVSDATNAALALASGSFIVRLGDGDMLSPRALHEAAVRIAVNPDVDILYSDEDMIDASGRRSMPYFKPGWNPDLLLSHNLINRTGIYRRALVDAIGGFRPELGDSQGYDLALRCVGSGNPARVSHVPHVLYHMRQHSRDDADKQETAGRLRAASDGLGRTIPGVRVEALPNVPSGHRVIYPIPRPEPLVSVIIPTRNHADMLARTMDGLLARTDYAALQVLIVDNGSDEAAALTLLDRLAEDARVQVLRCPGPFNYAALNNRAVREATGSLLLLLNNDVEVIHPDWLREMVSHAVRADIGAVGAKLLYPDDTIQHGGITLGGGNITLHPWVGQRRDDSGYFGQLGLVRNVAAVTAACLMVRRQSYLDVGGMDEIALAVAFNDVDLCLKLLEAGYRNLWTPHATLYHHESASRGSDLSGPQAARFEKELAHMRHRWAARLDRDPYWNPNLSPHTRDILLAFPPRRG